MRRKIAGVPVFAKRLTTGVQRPRTWTPDYSGRYGWEFGGWVIWVSWDKWGGYRLTGAWLDGSGWPGHRIDVSEPGESVVKKPPKPADPQKPEVLPPYETKVLKAFPRLTAFLTDQWYDDGEKRVRGSMWIDSEGMIFKALLKEPSLKLCVRIRAGSIDDLYKAAETFLGLDSPPWEVDEYAVAAAAKKGKK